MAVDTKQYAEELLKAAGVSDDNVKQAVINIFSNEAVAKRVSDDMLRQSDYSRNMDALTAKVNANNTYRQELVTWEASRKAEWERAIAEAANGNGDRQVIQTVQNPDVVTKKDFEAELQKRDGQFIGLLETGMSIASRHAVEFKEPLDTAALKKIAMEKNLSLQAAYDEMVAPRRAETGTAQRKAEIEAAKAEGAREFASKHKIPVDTQPREYHVLLDRDPKKQVGADSYVPNSGQLGPADTRQLRENFVNAWETAPARGTSGT
jgi:hypothetical protein